jgi:AraC-like DNA-binding protein
MRAIFEQVTPRIESSLSILQLDMAQFEAPYHYHPELELTYIRKSHGRRFVGGKVSDYEPGDLVLVGENIPHCWHSKNQSNTDKAQAIVIQFQKDFAGEKILELPESIRIRNLIENSKFGILITGNTRQKVIFKLEQCVASYGFYKLLIFMEILEIIATSDEIELIDNQSSGLTTSPAETERFQKIFGYLIENYTQVVTLKTVAEIANLTPTAFCRYFKNLTRKTLVEVVTEFRINQACLLLRITEKSVNEICFECGFGNISYFNKTFKTVQGKTPLKYRNLYRNI